MPDLHLYHMPAACSRITHVALEMTGRPYDVTVVRIHKGDLKDPAYLAINPAGPGPMSADRWKALRRKPQSFWGFLARLFPRSRHSAHAAIPSSRPRALARLSFCSGSLHPVVTRIMFPERFCDESEAAVARTLDARQSDDARKARHARTGSRASSPGFSARPSRSPTSISGGSRDGCVVSASIFPRYCQRSPPMSIASARKSPSRPSLAREVENIADGESRRHGL